MERPCCRPGQDVGGGVEPVCVCSRLAARWTTEASLHRYGATSTPLGGAAKRLGVGKSPEPYEEEGVDECVKELFVRTTQEKDEEEEDKRLHLVLGELFA